MITSTKFARTLPASAEAAIAAVSRGTALKSFLLILLPLSVLACALVLPVYFQWLGFWPSMAIVAVTAVLVLKRLAALLLHERAVIAGSEDEYDEVRHSDDAQVLRLKAVLVGIADRMSLPVPDLVYRPESEELRLEVFLPFSASQRSAVFADRGFVQAEFSDEHLETALAHEMGHVKVRSGRWFSWYLPLVNKAVAVALPLTLAALTVTQLHWGWLWLVPVLPLSFWGVRLAMAFFSAVLYRVHERAADAVADHVTAGGAIADFVQAMIARVLKEPDDVLSRQRPQVGGLPLLLFTVTELLQSHPHPDERIADSLARRTNNAVSPAL